MSVYKVEIITTTSRVVEVEAYDEIEAVSVVEQRFEGMRDLLDDHAHLEFQPVEEL